MTLKIFCRCSLFHSWSGQGLISISVSKTRMQSWPLLLIILHLTVVYIVLCT